MVSVHLVEQIFFFRICDWVVTHLGHLDSNDPKVICWGSCEGHGGADEAVLVLITEATCVRDEMAAKSSNCYFKQCFPFLA